MADHELNLCPILDIIVSHTLAFLKYEPSIVDFSITLGGGQYGVAFALYDPAAFTARFGTPPQPLLHPGPWRCTYMEMPNKLQTGVRGCASIMCKPMSISQSLEQQFSWCRKKS